MTIRTTVLLHCSRKEHGLPNHLHLWPNPPWWTHHRSTIPMMLHLSNNVRPTTAKIAPIGVAAPHPTNVPIVLSLTREIFFSIHQPLLASSIRLSVPPDIPFFQEFRPDSWWQTHQTSTGLSFVSDFVEFQIRYPIFSIQNPCPVYPEMLTRSDRWVITTHRHKFAINDSS